MSEILHVNTNNFEKEVLNNKGVTIVDFFATWCGPCKMLSPILEQVSKECDFVKIVKVDIDQALPLAKQFGIMSVPTMVIVADGKEQERLIGLRQKSQIIDTAKKYL